MSRLPAAIGLLVLFAHQHPAAGREFRRVRPVSAPEPLPKGAVAVPQLSPVDRRVVEAIVHELFKAWNGEGMEQHLADGFYDKRRFLDAMDEDVPKDARLRVLGLSNIQTVRQYLKARASGGGQLRVSTVSVTVTSQVEYNDPERGFQRREGVNEYIFEIIQEPIEGNANE